VKCVITGARYHTFFSTSLPANRPLPHNNYDN
jgi:hypothetical protein